jgi:hypothetical protein
VLTNGCASMLPDCAQFAVRTEERELWRSARTAEAVGGELLCRECVSVSLPFRC